MKIFVIASIHPGAIEYISEGDIVTLVKSDLSNTIQLVSSEGVSCGKVEGVVHHERTESVENIVDFIKDGTKAIVKLADHHHTRIAVCEMKKENTDTLQIKLKASIGNMDEIETQIKDLQYELNNMKINLTFDEPEEDVGKDVEVEETKVEEVKNLSTDQFLTKLICKNVENLKTAQYSDYKKITWSLRQLVTDLLLYRSRMNHDLLMYLNKEIVAILNKINEDEDIEFSDIINYGDGIILNAISNLVYIQMRINNSVLI